MWQAAGSTWEYEWAAIQTGDYFKRAPHRTMTTWPAAGSLPTRQAWPLPTPATPILEHVRLCYQQSHYADRPAGVIRNCPNGTIVNNQCIRSDDNDNSDEDNGIPGPTTYFTRGPYTTHRHLVNYTANTANNNMPSGCSASHLRASAST